MWCLTVLESAHTVSHQDQGNSVCSSVGVPGICRDIANIPEKIEMSGKHIVLPWIQECILAFMPTIMSC